MSRTINALSSAHKNISYIAQEKGRLTKLKEKIPELKKSIKGLTGSNLEQALIELSIEHKDLKNNPKHQGLTNFLDLTVRLEEELDKVVQSIDKISTITNNIDDQTIPEIARIAKKEVPGIDNSKVGTSTNNCVIETILSEKQNSQIKQLDAKIEFQNSYLAIIYQSDFSARVKGDVSELIEEMFDDSNNFFVFQGSGNYGLAKKTYILRKGKEAPQSNTIMNQTQRRQITIDAGAKIKFHNPFFMEINQALCYLEQKTDAYQLAKKILKDRDFLVFKGDDESDRTQKIYIVKESA